MGWTRRSVLVLVVMSGSAMAQIAPPPPPAPEPTPPYVPPPPAPAPAPRPQPAPAAPREARIDPADEMRKAQDIGFDSLVKRDSAGNILPLEQPTEWAALFGNPLVKDAPVTQAMFAPYLRERRQKMEQLVIDNVDLALRLEGDMLETLNVSDKGSVAQITPMIKPFTSLGQLTTELRKRDLLQPTQAGVSRLMIRDWTSANIAEINKATGGGEKGPDGKPKPSAERMDLVTRFMLRETIAEPMFIFQEVMLDTGKNLTEALKGAGIESSESVAAFGAATNREEQLNAIRKLLGTLSVDQQRALLRKGLELRPPLPPLPDVEEVKRANKEKLVDIEVSKRGQVVRPNDKLNTTPGDQPAEPKGDAPAAEPK